MLAELEVELKYRAQGAAPLRALARADRLGPARLEPAVTVAELDRYLDTPDGRLAAEGWACRLRLRHGAWVVSVKGTRLASATAELALHQRRELEGPASEAPDPADWPASRARELVRAVCAGRPLVERLRLAQRRSERGVMLNGSRVGILSLDEVTAIRDGRRLGTLHVAELELEGAGDGVVRELANALAARRGLTADPLTKLEHALALLARRGPEGGE